MAQYYYNEKQLYDFLSENTGYLKWGAAKIRRKFCQSDVSEETVNRIRRAIRNDVSYDEVDHHPANFSENTSDTGEDNDKEYIENEADEDVAQAYDEFLEKRGLTRDDVKSVKFWQTMSGKPRFSVVPFSNYQLNFSNLEDRFAETFGDITTPEIKTPSIDRGNWLGVLGLHDAHIDKVILASETGYDTDDTIEENVSEFEQRAINILLDLKSEGVEEVHVPVGSDFWTVNNDRNTTKRGTKQRVIVPFQESFEVGVEAVIRVIRFAAENFSVVKVPVIYGNHDEDLDFFLGMLLNQAFESTSHVEVNYDRVERKYYQFGKTGLCYAHGYNCKTKSAMQRLPLNFAEEATEIWSATKGGIRKALLGDIHNEEQYQFLRTKDSVGVSVQFMRSVSNTGKYEWDNGWTGVPKTAYGWMFNRDGSQEKVTKDIWW
jgi:hypothetical protein